jgi:hypothetical protein
MFCLHQLHYYYRFHRRRMKSNQCHQLNFHRHKLILNKYYPSFNLNYLNYYLLNFLKDYYYLLIKYE